MDSSTKKGYYMALAYFATTSVLLAIFAFMIPVFPTTIIAIAGFAGCLIATFICIYDIAFAQAEANIYESQRKPRKVFMKFMADWSYCALGIVLATGMALVTFAHGNVLHSTIIGTIGLAMFLLVAGISLSGIAARAEQKENANQPTTTGGGA